MLFHAENMPFIVLIVVVAVILYFGKIIHKASVATSKQFDHHLNGSLFALTYILLPLMAITITYNAVVGQQYLLVPMALGVMGYYTGVTVLSLANLLKHRGAYIVEYVENQLGDSVYPLKRLGVQHQWLLGGSGTLFGISALAMIPLYFFYTWQQSLLLGLAFVFATVVMTFVAMSYSLEGRDSHSIRVHMQGREPVEGKVRDYDEEIVLVEHETGNTVRINPKYVVCVEEIPEQFPDGNHPFIDLKSFMGVTT